jgi:hypothetical protein
LRSEYFPGCIFLSARQPPAYQLNAGFSRRVIIYRTVTFPTNGVFSIRGTTGFEWGLALFPGPPFPLWYLHLLCSFHFSLLTCSRQAARKLCFSFSSLNSSTCSLLRENALLLRLSATFWYPQTDTTAFSLCHVSDELRHLCFCSRCVTCVLTRALVSMSEDVHGLIFEDYLHNCFNCQIPPRASDEGDSHLNDYSTAS